MQKAETMSWSSADNLIFLPLYLNAFLDFDATVAFAIVNTYGRKITFINIRSKYFLNYFFK
jgi:hypothetical protein